MKKLFITVFVNYLFVCILVAQSNIDSLKQLLLTAKDDTNKVSLLLQIAENVSRSNPELGLSYSLKAVNLAEKLNISYYKAFSYRYLGSGYSNLGIYDSSLYFLNKSLKISTLNNYSNNIIILYTSIGEIKNIQGDSDSAMFFFNEALKLIKIENNEFLLSNTLNSKAKLFYSIGLIDSAFYYQKQVLDIQIKIKDSIGIGVSYSDLGFIQSQLGDYDNAMTYYNKAIKIRRVLTIDRYFYYICKI